MILNSSLLHTNTPGREQQQVVGTYAGGLLYFDFKIQIVFWGVVSDKILTLSGVFFPENMVYLSKTTVILTIQV